jgi:hypothetical protein
MNLVVRITPASGLVDDFLLLILHLIEERRVRVRLRVRVRQTRRSWSQCMRQSERGSLQTKQMPNGGERALTHAPKAGEE